jgi:hypothetical protein
MKTIVGVIIGLVVGIIIGVTGDVLATPPPAQDSTEGRLQTLEHLLWPKDHAINVVHQRLFDRRTSCTMGEYACYTTDPVLMPFAYVVFPDGTRPTEGVMSYMAQEATTNGQWYAKETATEIALRCGSSSRFTMTTRLTFLGPCGNPTATFKASTNAGGISSR